MAVNNVSFTIDRGEIFGFLGSNGCGKSTTMKMLTGLLPASSGEAKLFGETVEAGSIAIRNRVGYMSQAFSLYGELTVRQNLWLHARLYPSPTGENGGRGLTNWSIASGSRPHLDNLSESLPLGVRQRLSLAVAVIHEPEMLILDEPTSGVDPVARDEFWELLIDLSRQQSVTIFISTHFMNEAMRCDRISLMHAGTVLACDKPDLLREARMRRRWSRRSSNTSPTPIGRCGAPRPNHRAGRTSASSKARMSRPRKRQAAFVPPAYRCPAAGL